MIFKIFIGITLMNWTSASPASNFEKPRFSSNDEDSSQSLALYASARQQNVPDQFADSTSYNPKSISNNGHSIIDQPLPNDFHSPEQKYSPQKRSSKYDQKHEQQEPKNYDFKYGVVDEYGRAFGHTESKDGHRTEGMYYTELPDGRLQKVEYYVDEYGYHATVTYEGTAIDPNETY